MPGSPAARQPGSPAVRQPGSPEFPENVLDLLREVPSLRRCRAHARGGCGKSLICPKWNGNLRPRLPPPTPVATSVHSGHPDGCLVSTPSHHIPARNRIYHLFRYIAVVRHVSSPFIPVLMTISENSFILTLAYMAICHIMNRGDMHRSPVQRRFAVHIPFQPLKSEIGGYQ